MDYPRRSSGGAWNGIIIAQRSGDVNRKMEIKFPYNLLTRKRNCDILSTKLKMTRHPIGGVLIVGKLLTAHEKPFALEVHEALKRIRKEKKLSQQEFAERVGVSKKTVVNWEGNRNKPDLDTITRICNIMDSSPAELLGLQAPYGLESPEEVSLLSSFRLLSRISRRMVQRIVETMVEEEEQDKADKLKGNFRLFLVHPGKAAAGAGEELFDQEPSYCFLKKNDVNEEADGIIQVKGHSMEPDYPDGRSLYYKKAEDGKPGDDVLVNTGNGYVVKRLDDKKQLYSVNPDLPYTPAYQDMIMKIEGIILGLVPSTDRPNKEEREVLETIMEDEVKEFCISNGIPE